VSLAQLEPWLQPYARALVGYLGGRVTVTSVYRSPSEQLRLWNTRHRNPYPVAPPGTSKHERRLAWDMVGPPELLRWAGAVWKSWGGRWFESDPIHFEV